MRLARTEIKIGNIFGIDFTKHTPLEKNIRPQLQVDLPTPLQNKSILIVDDSEDNLEIIKLVLNSYGGEVDIAPNGYEALRRVKQKKYDVILMDIQMPELDGFQLLDELKKRENSIPVVALTANVLPEDKLKTRDAGFHAHVSKPIDFNQLVMVLKNA